MSINQTDVIDYATVDNASGDLWLAISDHLPWLENDAAHLALLQNKLNAYLRFIESGEVFKKMCFRTNQNIGFVRKHVSRKPFASNRFERNPRLQRGNPVLAAAIPWRGNPCRATI